MAVVSSGKTTVSSSIWETYSPDLAVDNNFQTNFYAGSCFSTDVGDMQPYWYVDLGRDCNIYQVTLTNRGDMQEERMRNIEVDVLTSPPTSMTPTGDFCGTVTGSVGAGETTPVYCPHTNTTGGFTFPRGRYVRVRKTSMEDKYDLLTLCEVRVVAIFFPTNGHFISSTNELDLDSHKDRFYGWSGRLF
ncbi:fucolectin-like [Haliotis asinina]|uniref:fucolectin-like n=1 Tax=Haliotis asinina TaxID=109174 RepID=UPI0035323158